jgi:F-type H+-transporting ATPase subunit gamma
MSRRRSVEQLLASYGEIAEILRAMRNLALMEIHKLGRGLQCQRQMVDGISAAAVDLLGHYPDLPAVASTRRETVLLLGSERGFCGAFNESILAAAPRGQWAGARVVAVGYRLSSRMTHAGNARAMLGGAAVAEEIPAVLGRLMDTLADGGEGVAPAPIRVTVVHHGADAQAVETAVLDPFALGRQAAQKGLCPPLLHGAPDAVFAELTRHFLWARLQYLLTDSLMAENQHRLAHMDNAMRHVDEEMGTLGLRRNALRQEEITEEIETILLNADNRMGFQEGLNRSAGENAT